MTRVYVQPNYLPLTSDKRNKWLTNFAVVLAANSTLLNVDPADVTYIQLASAWYNYLLNVYFPYVRAFSKGTTSLLEDLDNDATPQATILPTFAPSSPPSGTPVGGIFNFIANLVTNTILKSENLTPSLKTALGLDPIPALPAGAPRIKGAEAQSNGLVDLTFTRGGFPLVIIEGCRGDESDWTVLDKVAAAHYLDNRPNLVAGRSESREYRIRYSDGSNAVGDYSAIETMTTQA